MAAGNFLRLKLSMSFENGRWLDEPYVGGPRRPAIWGLGETLTYRRRTFARRRRSVVEQTSWSTSRPSGRRGPSDLRKRSASLRAHSRDRTTLRPIILESSRSHAAPVGRHRTLPELELVRVTADITTTPPLPGSAPCGSAIVPRSDEQLVHRRHDHARLVRASVPCRLSPLQVPRSTRGIGQQEPAPVVRRRRTSPSEASAHGRRPNPRPPRS
jgi:hypothetical protein